MHVPLPLSISYLSIITELWEIVRIWRWTETRKVSFVSTSISNICSIWLMKSLLFLELIFLPELYSAKENITGGGGIAGGKEYFAVRVEICSCNTMWQALFISMCLNSILVFTFAGSFIFSSWNTSNQYVCACVKHSDFIFNSLCVCVHTQI